MRCWIVLDEASFLAPPDVTALALSSAWLTRAAGVGARFDDFEYDACSGTASWWLRERENNPTQTRRVRSKSGRFEPATGILALIRSAGRPSSTGLDHSIDLIADQRTSGGSERVQLEKRTLTTNVSLYTVIGELAGERVRTRKHSSSAFPLCDCCTDFACFDELQPSLRSTYITRLFQVPGLSLDSLSVVSHTLGCIRVRFAGTGGEIGPPRRGRARQPISPRLAVYAHSAAPGEHAS